MKRLSYEAVLEAGRRSWQTGAGKDCILSWAIPCSDILHALHLSKKETGGRGHPYPGPLSQTLDTHTAPDHNTTPIFLAYLETKICQLNGIFPRRSIGARCPYGWSCAVVRVGARVDAEIAVRLHDQSVIAVRT